MPLTDDDIREILRLIDESDVQELRVETSAFSLHVVRGDTVSVGIEPEHAERTPAEPAPPPATSTAVDVHTIPAPLLGTFYRAEAPGAAPFVAVGTRVEEDTVVCLIEVMKMMNPVPAGVVGTIVEVCAENAELVEYGAPLFLVDAER
jgi:acetyl-CoA carboxylase biotin carboxyl carrier protein